MALLPAINFEGQTALVTGGTRGLGLAVALYLAEAGARVTVCGRTEPDSLPAILTYAAADIRDPDAARGVVHSVAQANGRIDILVNNAGGSPQCPAAEASPRFIEAIMKLNLLAPLYLAQAAYPYMAQQKSGSIVNIASVSGIRPSPGTAAYGAAKAGLLNLTQSLAQEWGKDNVRVNAIIVGLAKTEMAEATYGDAAAQQAVAESLPLGRMCEGSDVAQTVAFLCSPMAAYISGARLNVDGGGERPYFLDLIHGS
jgi:NAD(P)-dependent dehydrogenase (short-subunit alcohol dehydrogenase family)